MVKVTFIDETEFNDLADPAKPVPTVLVTARTEDGRVFTFRVLKAQRKGLLAQDPVVLKAASEELKKRPTAPSFVEV